MYNHEYVQSLLDDYNSTGFNREISPTETMNDQWYFQMGGYALEAITLAIRASKIREHSHGPKITKVLDLPCGHGRVLRHLACLFKDAEIHACDLDKDGVNFCAEKFGAIPIHSEEDLIKIDFGCQYDLIWIGSLFTHTSQTVTKKWLTHLAKFLSPQGIIVTTVHGRWAESVHKVAPYINEPAWKKVIKQYRRKGYGYQDYFKDESHSYISGSYGISIAKPHVTIKDIEEIPDTRVYLYLERAWGDHQDVVVFGRPSYAELWPDQ